MTRQKNEKDKNRENLKEISKWTLRYAQNRTIPVLVFLVVFLFLFFGIAGVSRLLGKAIQAENTLLTGIGAFMLVLSLAALVFFSVPKWGGKFIEAITLRLYGNEGTASLPPKNNTKKHKRLGYLVGLIFGTCVIASVKLGAAGYLPIEYMQPISAIYVVPFLVFLVIWQKPMIGLLGFLWPILYLIHAVLVILGAPIQFSGELTGLNMLIPTVGYGTLSAFISHIYSRYALKKLKGITHLNGGNANEA